MPDDLSRDALAGPLPGNPVLPKAVGLPDAGVVGFGWAAGSPVPASNALTSNALTGAALRSDVWPIEPNQAHPAARPWIDRDAGDRSAPGGYADLADLARGLAQSRPDAAPDSPAQMSLGTTPIHLLNTNHSAASVTAALAQPSPGCATFVQFRDSGSASQASHVTIGQTVYELRTSEPLHDGYKYQDAQGRWWSPDMFVVVAAGQSNMDGGASGGPLDLSGNVVAYDWVNDRLIQADYLGAPANGVGVRTGTVIRNNLYFPFAEQIAAELDRPVLVVAHPVSGSRIDSWLATGAGTNWAVLNADVDHALQLAGLDHADSFIWLQGESDYPVPVPQFQQLFLQFVSQVRAQAWAGGDMAFLAGELSRLGINDAQNAAFQAIERDNPDAMLRFVSSVGLTAATDPTGVHFDAASLIAYGGRFWDAFAQLIGLTPPPDANTAPTLRSGATPPTAITMTEGQTLTLNVAPYFTDAEGDSLWFYSSLSRRQVHLETSIDNQIVLRPDFNAAGTYTLRIYASDYDLDGQAFNVQLTVLDRAPTVDIYSSSTFTTRLQSYSDLSAALAAATTNRGIDVLSQAAVQAADMLLRVDSLRLRGGDGISASFVLAEAPTRVFLYGEADFNVTGNARNNLFNGNAGDNRLSGVAGQDRLSGFAGNDVLVGGLDNDTVLGGTGNDLLDTGAGNDMAWGGQGADVFVLRAGEGQLYVRDFEVGQDRLRIGAYAGIDDFTDLTAAWRITQLTDRVVIDLGSDRLMLTNVQAVQLTAGIFDFI